MTSQGLVPSPSLIGSISLCRVSSSLTVSLSSSTSSP
ncbi:hypothetical protein ID866_10017 [Astraeus odoratus]|nr:hypothetical protein ID866_10017 [Astraeus odoratus]